MSTIVKILAGIGAILLGAFIGALVIFAILWSLGYDPRNDE